MTLTVTILGCGSSGGVPRAGQGWGACDPGNPRNRRRRCSILVERSGPEGKTVVLVDTGPDLREQMLGADVRRLDGVILTHDHADHTHGIDDLRPFAIEMKRRIDVHCDAATAQTIHDRFGYIVKTPAGSAYPPIVNLCTIEPYQDFSVSGPGGDVWCLPFHVRHGGDYLALGLRFNNFVYCPDIKEHFGNSKMCFEGSDTVVLDCLRYAPHPTHFNLDDALELLRHARPKRAVLTNLHTDLDYADLMARLPPGVEPAFDGMMLEVPLAAHT